MKKILVCLWIVLCASQFCEAQQSHIIRFRDKGTNTNTLDNPSAYLSPRAIARRIKYNIAVDSTDLPVTARYLDSLRAITGVEIINVSKWLNAVSIRTNDANALVRINSFSFVLSVNPIAPKVGSFSGRQAVHRIDESQDSNRQETKSFSTTEDFFQYGASYNQLHIHNGEFLHNIGLRGQNMIIGMLDAGYMNYLTVNAFDSIRANNQILGVYDFVAKDSSVNEDAAHGMQCFSTIGANIPGQFVGSAPKASFYLFRSENSTGEFPVEEYNWVCAAERVDSVGGELISSSLGYTVFDPPLQGESYVYADMNGNTTLAARGADLAAKKGILVVNSAGNDGAAAWHYIATPADGDSVLAVGAVNTAGVVAGFSSYGPSADGQVKPDVASVGQGTVIQNPNNIIGLGSGTSFAAPNMAGLATCLWQGFPEFNNMGIIGALRQSGNQYLAPNNRTGYGIPDMKKAVMILLKEFSTATASAFNCKATISWTSKDLSSMRYEIERKLPGHPTFQKIGEQAGTGPTFSAHNYQFEDDLTDQPTGNIVYRIRQVIDTSASGLFGDYIDTISVNLGMSCISGNAVTLLPNPTRGDLLIKIATLEASPGLVIRIFNTKGQLIAEQKHNKPSGILFFDVSMQRFPAGTYFVTVYDGDKVLATKELVKL